MKTRIHALAGGIGFLVILTFWTSTVISELFASYATVTAVKQWILYGMIILIPALAIAGGSGMVMGGKRTDAPAMAKKRRMPFIAANGLLILVPSAFYLASKASAGAFDHWFYGVQILELIAGAANLTMMGLNIRDGMVMTGRIGGAAPPSGTKTVDPVLEGRDGGPLMAKNLPRLTGADGAVFDLKPVMALCRCGTSKNKPFCDGSHNEIGFDTCPAEDRTPDILQAFESKDITVHYNKLLCSHAGECGKRLKSVFDTSRTPWIDPAQGNVDDIIAVVQACPSGALSYGLPGGPVQHAIGGAPGILIEQNGPYRVTGIPFASARQASGACSDKYVLCRCGASKNKPYCDGTHHEIGWDD